MGAGREDLAKRQERAVPGVAEEAEQVLAVHRQPLRPLYHEIDGMRIVYHGRYMDWFTRGRIDLLASLGVSYPRFEEEGLFLPVLHLECHYRVPVALGDELELETRLVECRRTRMAFTYRVWRGETLCAFGRTSHAFVDGRGRPIDVKKRFPALWETLVKVFE